MASARKKNGRWYYRITIVVGNGEKKYIERGSYRTKKEAIDAGKAAEDICKKGMSTDLNYMTFRYLSDQWLKSFPDNYKPTTMEGYEKELRTFILPAIGDVYLSALTPKQCQSIIDDAINSHHSRNRVAKIKGVICQCMKFGVRNGYMKSNPAKDIYLPKIRSVANAQFKKERQMRALPKEEIDAIFERFPEGHPDFIPLLLGYRCGLRLGEAFGVMINDVDLKERCLTVRQQIQYDGEQNRLYFTDPKYCNPGETRTIYLDEDTWRILKRHIKKLTQCRVVLSYPTYYVTKERYFTDKNEPGAKEIYPLNIRPEDGTFIAPRTMQNVGRVIHGKTSNFACPDPLWDFHSMRHTHASECIAAGMSPVMVQKRLGHKNLATTYRYYIHETETQVTESRDIINKMYEN